MNSTWDIVSHQYTIAEIFKETSCQAKEHFHKYRQPHQEVYDK